MTAAEIIALMLLLLLAYIYLGYPLLLWLASAVFKRPARFDSSYEPRVTLVISAYNEAEVIGEKLDNSLAIDYPAEKLEIVVVSDCSSDGTDQRVLAYADRGIRLVRASERRGKTSALNSALESIDNEIVIFSDANAIYDRQAIRYLVGHFVDQEVGYVVGHARYQEESPTAAGGSEGAYWDLEVRIKECESRLSSVVGGDGAIYAIRRSLYQPMQETDINDFVNPLQIVAKGYRGVFDRRAWCVERPAGEFNKEFSRKVRIANRSFNAVLRVPQALNPFRVGIFSWQLLSHKVLRWFSPFFLACAALDLAVLLTEKPFSALAATGATASGSFIALALVGWHCSDRKIPPLFSLPYYFMLMNLASAIGILLRLRGKTITTWTTVRAGGSGGRREISRLRRLALYLTLLALALVSCGGMRNQPGLDLLAWLLLGVLLHGYLGYPLLLTLLGMVAGRRIGRDEGYLPPLTLLIVAHNEEREIEMKLRNSLQLDYPRESLQIIVASDGSTDGTNAIVSRYRDQGIILLAYAHNRGKICALNDAMREATGEIVVLSDANVEYRPSALKRLARNFADPRVGVVSGKVILRNGTLSYREAENGYYGIEHLIQEKEGGLGVLVGADGAMYAIRRSLFTPPPPDTILDDLVISLAIARQGYLVVHDKEAMGFEVNRTELAGEFRRKARIIAGGYGCLLRSRALPGISQPLLLFCFLSHKVLRWYSGFLLIALAGVLVQLHCLSAGEVNPLLTLVLAAMAMTLLLAALVQLFPSFKSFRLTCYSHYFFMLLAASVVGCYLGLTGRQKVAWRGGVS